MPCLAPPHCLTTQPPFLIQKGSVIRMSPYLISADLASTDLGRHARATTTVAQAEVLSITDLFERYAAARKAGDLTLMRQIREAADTQLAAELDGFDYPATA